MNKGLLGKISLFSLIFLAVIIVSIFILPVFSAPAYVGNPSFNFSNGTAYSTSNVFKFESNWTNTSVVNNVTWGNSTNFTLGRPDGTITIYNLSGTTPQLYNNTTTLPVRLNITFTQSQLGPAGIYNFSFGLNVTNSSGTYTNVTTPVVVLNVSIATPGLSLTNSSTTYSAFTLVNGTVVTGDAVGSYNISLYRNGTLVNSTTSASFTFENVTLGVGVWNYTIVYNGSENYTSTSLTNYTNISKGTLSLALSVPAVTYPNNVTATVTASNSGASDINYTLYRNNSLVNFSATNGIAPAGEIILLGNGTYNYTINTTVGPFANWTVNATGITANVIVSKGTLDINISGSNVSYPTSVSINGIRGSNSVDADVNYTLWKNSTLVTSGFNTSGNLSDTTRLGVGWYVYTYNATGGANWTANSTGVTLNINVSKGVLNLSLSASNLTYPNNVTATVTASNSGASDVNYTLYRNNSGLVNFSATNGTAPNENVLLGVGGYLYTLNASGTYANWTTNITGVNAIANVSQGTPTLVITGPTGWAVTYPTSATTICTATSQNSEVTAFLYRNGANVTTYTETVLSTIAVTYNYTCNSSATANYTAGNATSQLLTLSASSSTTGGSTSTGTSSTSSSAYITLGVGKANITMTTLTTSGKLIASIAKYQDVAIRGMNITVVNNVANIKIMITKVNTLPSTVPFDISGKVYNYISIDEANFTDSDMKQVNMTFAVNKTWLTNNNIDASNMTMYRWANNKWNDLGAIKVSEDTSEVFYTVSSPGLSVFVIGTKGVQAQAPSPTPVSCTENWSCTDWSACVNETQTKTCTDSNACGTTASKPSESQSCTPESSVTPPTSFPILNYVIVIVAIVVCVLIFLERNKITSYFQKPSKKKTQFIYKKPS